MSEILLDSLVRSVETLEKKTDKMQGQVNGIPDHSEFHKNVADRLGAAENDIKELPGKIFMPLPEILGLTHELQVHSQLLSTPLKQEIRHEHHLSKPIIVCIILSFVVFGLLFLEFYTWFQADQHKDNDIKYRFLKAFQDSKGQKFLHRIPQSGHPTRENRTRAIRRLSTSAGESRRNKKSSRKMEPATHTKIQLRSNSRLAVPVSKGRIDKSRWLTKWFAILSNCEHQPP